MKDSHRIKFLYYFLIVALLVIMILQSLSAGISCDEMLHHNHAVTVVNYFTTGGADTSALNTPVSNLKYYGQSPDNIAAFVARWTNTDNVYLIRHIFSSLLGWMLVVVTSLCAIWLSGYRSAVAVIILFSITPVFMGHSMNNLKDIPFALSYIASVYFSFRLLWEIDKPKTHIVVLLILSIAFSISIRAGGLLLICYLYFFWVAIALFKWLNGRRPVFREEVSTLILITVISGCSWFCGILLWPYALQDPIKNVIESYTVMAHFPSTFRQLFEGRNLWSDMMPWYYLPKSILITIPVVVTAGVALFLILLRKTLRDEKRILWLLVIFTFIFPVLFVIISKSNIYSLWRQFLFLLPIIILISAEGFTRLFDLLQSKWLKTGVLILLIVFSSGPVLFMLSNHPYQYLYFNELAGGIRGANGNYDNDYYFTSQTEASEWLIEYLESNGIDSALIGATYPVDWQFRDYPEYKTFYMRNEERSQYDWDFAIITNRYITADRLKNEKWPPEDALHTITAGGVPVCTVLKRKTKNDYLGFNALQSGNADEAVRLFSSSECSGLDDELFFYNFAQALRICGLKERSDSVISIALSINPDYEPLLMYCGNIALTDNDPEKAQRFYEKIIELNPKYFQAYTALSGVYSRTSILSGRELLRKCLTINPDYIPAITALADTYRESDPEIARKYDGLAEKMKYKYK